MNQALFLDTLEEMGFDYLPAELQDKVENLADEEGETIDSLWIEIVRGNYNLPRYLEKELTGAAKEFLRSN